MVPWRLDRLWTTWLAGRLHSRDGCDCGQVKRMEGKRGAGGDLQVGLDVATREMAAGEKWCSGEASQGLMRGRWKAGRPCATGKSPSRPPSPFSAIRKCGKNDPLSPLTARYCYSALHRLNISSSVHILLHTLHLPGCRPLPHSASPCQMHLGKHWFPRHCCSSTCETRNMPYLDLSLKRVPLHHSLIYNDWPRPLSTRRVIACILRHIFTALSRPGLPFYAFLGRFSRLTRENGLWARGAGWWLRSHCFLRLVHHDFVMPS